MKLDLGKPLAESLENLLVISTTLANFVVGTTLITTLANNSCHPRSLRTMFTIR